MPNSTPRASLPLIVMPFVSVRIEYPSAGPEPRCMRMAGFPPEAEIVHRNPWVLAATSSTSNSTAFRSGP